MKKFQLSSLLLLVLGCGLHSALPKAPAIAEVRNAAHAHPGDRKLASELALLELFGRGGDPAQVTPALARALELNPGSPRLLFASGLNHDVHGDPRAALPFYLQAIEAAAGSAEPDASHLIEGSVAAIGGADGGVPGYDAEVHKRLMPLLMRSDLPGPARSALADLLFVLAQRRADQAESARMAAALGCVTELRVAGPFGPRELLGFDDKPPADPASPLADQYDLGPARGVRATRTAHARGCTLHLGGGPVSEAGTTVAQARVSVPAAGDYLVRLDTPNNIELFIDGRSVQRIDRRVRVDARVAYKKLSLSAGSHLLTVRVSTRHPNPVVELSLLPSVPADEQASALPFRADATDFELYLRTAIALVRGDLLEAREELTPPSTGNDAAALFLLQRASVALNDPLLPDDVRRDDGRRYLAQAHARDPELWAPSTQLAALAAKNGRVKEAITALREASVHWKQAPGIGFALIDLLRNKGRSAEAEREIARLRELVPDACGPVAAELESLRSRQRQAEAAAVADKLVACDARSTARYTMLVGRRDFAAAEQEAQRLASLEPPEDRYTWLVAELALAKNRGDDKAVAARIAELRQIYPRSYSGAIEEIDALASRGDQKKALSVLESALLSEPTALANLYRLAPVLGGQHVLGAYRKDAGKAIAEFEASGRKYDGPQVLVLDYLAVRVFADGSSLELVHTVQKAQSDEAVNDLAEVQVPEGAQVLSLRAWKPDGRKLEADAIAGKDSVSLPNVASGDYVELEYMQANAPSDGFPRGYLGERFYFKSFEVPFHHSHMVVILPKDMPYAVDPRGPAPKLEEKLEGDLRILTWQAHESLPLVAEPSSVSAREFIPSIRVGVNATWQALVESLRDGLVDRDLYDPYYETLVHQIVGDAAPQDYRLRAERLYSWVLAHVDNNNDVFSQAALMLRAKAGNRARVLHYLLKLAGVPSKLALAHNFTADSTVSSMADADTYDHMLVRVDLSADKAANKTPLWLFTVERWAPFGYLPPVLRGQPALLLEPGAPQVSVSQGLLGEDFRKFALDIEVHKDGSARIAANETVHGSDAVSWRQQLEQIPAAELQRRFEQDYIARLFPGAKLGSLQITGREQDRPDLTLAYTIDVATFGRRTSGGIALPAILPTELASNFARTATRKTAELMPSSVHNEMTIRIKAPDGAKLPERNAPVLLKGAFAGRPAYSESSALDQGKLVLVRTLTMPAMRVEPKDYAVLSEFCRQVDASEGRELLIKLP